MNSRSNLLHFEIALFHPEITFRNLPGFPCVSLWEEIVCTGKANIKVLLEFSLYLLKFSLIKKKKKNKNY